MIQRKGNSTTSASAAPMLRVGAVAAVFAIAVALATTIRSGGAAEAGAGSKPVAVPVVEATVACPKLETGENRQARVASVSGPADLPGGSKPGRLEVVPLGERKAAASLTGRGKVARVEAKNAMQPPLVSYGAGSLAPGATSGLLTRELEGPQRGLAETPCPRPGSEFWFVGPGGTIGRHPKLYVTNTENTSARIDVLLYDKNGAIDAESIRSIDIPAQKSYELELEKVSAMSDMLAVNLQATRGRVTAVVRDHQTIDGQPAGVDWLPSAALPSRDVVIPGVPGGKGARLLSIVNPGKATALVDLKMLGPHGSFPPAKYGRLEIPPGTVRQVDLQRVALSEVAGLRIRSDVPITASLRADVGGLKQADNSHEDPREISYLSATEPLDTAALVPTTPSGKDRTSTLILSAPAKGSRAEVAVIADDGTRVKSATVEVPKGGTRQFALPKSEGDKGYMVVVKPDRPGRLHGVRVLTEVVRGGEGEGRMISMWPLSSAPTTAIRPVARPDIGTR